MIYAQLLTAKLDECLPRSQSQSTEQSSPKPSILQIYEADKTKPVEAASAGDSVPAATETDQATKTVNRYSYQLAVNNSFLTPSTSPNSVI